MKSLPVRSAPFMFDIAKISERRYFSGKGQEQLLGKSCPFIGLGKTLY